MSQSTTEADAGAGEDETAMQPAHDYIELKTENEIQALEQKQLYAYVEKLHGIIRKYDTKIATYKKKLKPFLNKQSNGSRDMGTQVSNEELAEAAEAELESQEQEKDEAKELSATDAFSFVDEMRQAARHAENLNNFVYEPTSGMYYDPKTGYYYNAEYGLYYDGNTGCYYSYDQSKDSYEFHSQAQANEQKAAAEDDDADELLEVEFDEQGQVITDKKTLKQIKAEKQKIKDRAAKSKRKAKKKHKKKHSKKSKKRHRHSDSEEDRRRSRKARDAEDGELSESSSSSSTQSSDEESNNSDSQVPIFKAAGRFQDIAKKYPPSLRIIVQETNVQELTVGSLHLITYKGGSLGREGAHDVIIPDVNVSKCHLKFHYDTKQSVYKCRDLGSRNGTILNGQRMCESKLASSDMDLVHGSVIAIAQTKLLCHVHEGNSTCGLCEPGLLIEKEAAVTPVMASNILSHKEQLKKLQKKYGLENEKFVESSSTANPNYNDRSAQRRIKVGSSTDKEKTEVACVNTEIASSNKGFKMLSKLGWQKGETLGKSNQGLLTPINVVGNEGTSGLGSNEPAPVPVDKRKLANLKITQARYQRANEQLDASD
ncbi:angiogenic factor with G patch and FHA domains 1 isoform X2 [Drosophila busckii]|uniref:angiogenic factor with G patch and FHA domains 1 isoform X2 n=1 Tax=Drosophila busckii TaxID=30019 RepID=UPI00083EEE8C|nr:angiogenic factor with G patch and FHA domains 1 isoform X2 [Drosophila busckii]